MTAGAVLAGCLTNREFGFYSSLSDLLSSAPVDAPAAVAAGPDQAQSSIGTGVDVLDQDWRTTGLARADQGRGTVLTVQLRGSRSGFDRPGLVYLPAAWFLDGRRALPVVELLHGYPGIPQNLRDQLHFGDVLDREIVAQRMPPVVAVAPKTYQGRASECVDAGRGRLNETYLSYDVPAALHSAFGTRVGRSLGLLGYSEGGFCAAEMGLHHPERVAAAVSLSGYFTAGTDPHTLDLYKRTPGLREYDSPLWWVEHRAPAGPPLLVVATRDDADSVLEDDALRRAAARHAPRLFLLAAELPTGGHNFATFARALAPGLDFLGAHLPAPLAHPLQLPTAPRLSGTGRGSGGTPSHPAARPPAGSVALQPRPSPDEATPRGIGTARRRPTGPPAQRTPGAGPTSTPRSPGGSSTTR